MLLCIFGAASDTVPEIYIKRTELLGSLLAERGHGIIFGGGSTGMMGAAARGAQKKEGHILGVAPRFFNKPGVLTDACHEIIFTDTMDERKAIMVRRADGFIVAPGGIGTLDEFFEVLTLRSLEQNNKPIALYNISGYFDELFTFLRKMESEHFISASLWDSFGIFDEPDDLLDYLEQSINPHLH